MSKYMELPWSHRRTIENLKEIKEHMQEKVIIRNLHGRGEKDAEEVAFDFDRAINALEKQIPKKPNMGGSADKFQGGIYICPICCGVVGIENVRADYCADCGQRLDWSEE